jgi:hypothetical protein
MRPVQNAVAANAEPEVREARIAIVMMMRFMVYSKLNAANLAAGVLLLCKSKALYVATAFLL